MFHDVEKKINRKKHNIEYAMQKTLPQIYNALFPSATAIATETRLELEASREELKLWMANHPDLVEQQQSAFRSILEKYSSISNRVKKITQ